MGSGGSVRSSVSAKSSRSSHGRAGDIRSFSSKTKKVVIKNGKMTRRKIQQSAKEKMFQKCSRLGFYGVFETGISTTTTFDDTAWIGHATYANHKYADAFCFALVKWVAKQYNCQIRAWSDACAIAPSGTASNLTIYGRTKADGLPINVSSTALDGLSYEGVASNLLAGFALWLGSTLVQNQQDPELCYMEIKQDNFVIETKRFDLTNMTCKFVVESILKVQNVTPAYSETANEDDDNADEITAVPLTINQYLGRGTFLKGPQLSMNFGTGVVTPSNGFIQFNGGDGTDGIRMKVPPLKNHFTNVDVIRKTSMGPGEIRTSKLDKVHGGKVNNNLRKWSVYDAQNSLSTKEGKFAVYSFEHVIKPLETYSKLKFLGQLDYRIGAFVKIPQTVASTITTDQDYVTL